MSENSDLIKLILTGLTVVIASPSLPLTGGTSGAIAIGVILTIWGIEWDV